MFLVFHLGFQDTVDILVGWHIDTSQQASLTSYTSGLVAVVYFSGINDIQQGFKSSIFIQVAETPQLGFFYFCLSNFTYKLGKDFGLLQTIVKP